MALVSIKPLTNRFKHGLPISRAFCGLASGLRRRHVLPGQPSKLSQHRITSERSAGTATPTVTEPEGFSHSHSNINAPEPPSPAPVAPDYGPLPKLLTLTTAALFEVAITGVQRVLDVTSVRCRLQHPRATMDRSVVQADERIPLHAQTQHRASCLPDAFPHITFGAGSSLVSLWCVCVIPAGGLLWSPLACALVFGVLAPSAAQIKDREAEAARRAEVRVRAELAARVQVTEPETSEWMNRMMGELWAPFIEPQFILENLSNLRVRWLHVPSCMRGCMPAAIGPFT
jgi:hypothetical protein